jgi:hypothetical protein
MFANCEQFLLEMACSLDMLFLITPRVAREIYKNTASLIN